MTDNMKWKGYNEADPLGDLNSFRDQVRQEKGLLSTIPLEVKELIHQLGDVLDKLEKERKNYIEFP